VVNAPSTPYRGRLAPSPTGYLHLGHARTFWIAQERARAAGGTLILRNDDLDSARCRREYVAAMTEDLRWFGLDWTEGPDTGGPHAPYDQSKRRPLYAATFDQLRAAGLIYPCTCSRKDVQAAMSAPHESPSPPAVADEPPYPGTCRPENLSAEERARRTAWPRAQHNWRLRVPAGETLSFSDGHFGAQAIVTGPDLSDFLVWRKDDLPSYQLACAVDDAAMRITEVVRGADLLRSTFRQLLLYRALGLPVPAFYHCDLMLNKYGIRLAKRYDSLSLRTLREEGRTPEDIRRHWR
jgi:glutamyl/glutaminyl-tRNA synthetase